jgi:hypothetical protein
MGNIADAVSLIYMDNPSAEELRNMDLFMISEIRRKDNATEIKFFDRYKALNRLVDEDSAATQSVPLFEALEAGAEKLGSNDED